MGVGAPVPERAYVHSTVCWQVSAGLFQQFVGAHFWYSLRLSERTFLEGSLLVRRFVILRKGFCERASIDGDAGKSHAMAAARSIEPRKRISKPGNQPCGPSVAFWPSR